MTHKNRLVALFAVLALLTCTGALTAQAEPSASQSFIIYLPSVNHPYTLPPVWVPVSVGSAVDVKVNPKVPNTVYAGLWGVGFVQTADGGKTWQATNYGLPTTDINAVAIDPNDPLTIYVGTDSFGIYRSTDGGITWTAANEGIQDGDTVYDIAIDPTNTDVLYAGTRGISNNGAPPWKGVLYKSIDGGYHWTSVFENVGGPSAQDWVYSIAINPSLTSMVFAASHEHGPWVSMDGGQTWKSLAQGLYDLTGRAVLVDPRSANPAYVYYGNWHESGEYKGTVPYDPVSPTLNANWINQGAQKADIYRFTIDPNNPDTVYAATFARGVYKTTTAGKKWFVVGMFYKDLYRIAVDPQNSQKLYAGTYLTGIQISFDGGSSWKPAAAAMQGAGQ